MSEPESKFSLRHIVVKRTARFAVLGTVGPEVREVWIVCHGYAQLAERFIERFRGIASTRRLIIAPEALSRFYSDRGAGFHGPSSQVGATWMTAEDRESEIADYVAYLDAVHDEIFRSIKRGSASLRVLGFSQGASTVARWIAAGHSKADQVIVWAGSLPPELTREGAARLNAGGGPLLIVAGTEDPFITSRVLDTQVDALTKLGITTEVRRFLGAHEIDPAFAHLDRRRTAAELALTTLPRRRTEGRGHSFASRSAAGAHSVIDETEPFVHHLAREKRESRSGQRHVTGRLRHLVKLPESRGNGVCGEREVAASVKSRPLSSGRVVMERKMRLIGKSGFTLIEVLVTVVVIGVLAAVVIPAVTAQVTAGDSARVLSDLNNIRTGAENFDIAVRQFPGDIDDLVNRPGRDLSVNASTTAGSVDADITGAAYAVVTSWNGPYIEAALGVAATSSTLPNALSGAFPSGYNSNINNQFAACAIETAQACSATSANYLTVQINNLTTSQAQSINDLIDGSEGLLSSTSGKFRAITSGTPIAYYFATPTNSRFAGLLSQAKKGPSGFRWSFSLGEDHGSRRREVSPSVHISAVNHGERVPPGGLTTG